MRLGLVECQICESFVEDLNEHMNSKHFISETTPEIDLGELPAKGDSVNHPAHYNEHPSGVECIEIVRHMNFNLGNACKYIWRAGLKGRRSKLIEDLKKARWYIEDEIKRLESSK